jgi:hypothetical protein
MQLCIESSWGDVGETSAALPYRKLALQLFSAIDKQLVVSAYFAYISTDGEKLLRTPMGGRSRLKAVARANPESGAKARRSLALQHDSKN